MTCAGAVVLKGHMHVKKEEERNNVCGAMVLKRNAHVKKGKARNGVCGAGGKGGAAHVKKEKAGNGVCGAAPAIRSHPKKETCTRLQKNPTTIIKNKTSGNFFQPYSILLL